MRIDNKNIKLDLDVKIKRPLFYVSLVFFMSILMASFLNFNVNISLIFLIFLALPTVFYFWRNKENKRNLKLLLVLLLTMSFGIFSYVKKNNFEFEKLLAFSGKEIIIDATVKSYPEYTDKSTVCDVKLNNIAGVSKIGDFKLKLYLKEASTIKPNDRFFGKVMCFSQYLDAPNKLKKYYKSKNQPISFSVFSDEEFVWKEKESIKIGFKNFNIKNFKILAESSAEIFSKFVLDSRRYLKSNLNKAFSNGQSALMTGMLLGDKTGVDYQTKRIFSLSGISHLLAVSGLHISILLQTIYRLLDFFKFGKKRAGVVVFVFTVFFVALTGFSPSAVRAGIMNSVCVLGSLMKREPDSLSSLGVALLVILLINPFAALDLGLQLSFAATLSIILFYNRIYGKICDLSFNFISSFSFKKQEDEKIRDRKIRDLKFEDEKVENQEDELKNNKVIIYKLYKAICSSVAISIAALILTVPITLFNFGSVSFAAPLTNVLLTPVIAPTLMFVSVTAVLGGFSFFDFGYKFFALLSSIGMNIIKGVATMMAQLPFSYISINKKYLYICFISIFALFLIYKYILKNQNIKKYFYLYSLIILLVGKMSNDIFTFGQVNFQLIGRESSYVNKNQKNNKNIGQNAVSNCLIADSKSSVAVLTQSEKFLMPNIDDAMKLLGVNYLDTVVLGPDIDVAEAIKIISVYRPYKIISDNKLISLIKNNIPEKNSSIKLAQENETCYLLQKGFWSTKTTELVEFNQEKILINNKNKKLKVF